MRDDDDRPRKATAHEIGQRLDTLSVEDLAERIALLRQEIERLEAARQAKVAALGAADAFFKR
ncbi:DUF1192 domain-containing protein [Methylobacterium dankookense]|uniref:DUF1192 domain-containing protein n=1 Tax=Methylobacterium dankookense TaxID=560405 RepID=A0A564FRP0_9HYPH|nr:DUF1192 domain-containing protein [Methylobacterium dankookense]GJD59477.1 hypothetical protein IFDJLNFL_5405 [Methylobacterium dankookense]VUF10380.1 hypothetical protein MTDSW087_00044 [Methylobacterium dankookense]